MCPFGGSNLQFHYFILSSYKLKLKTKTISETLLEKYFYSTYIGPNMAKKINRDI